MDSYDIGINFHNYLSSRIFYLLIIIYNKHKSHDSANHYHRFSDGF